MSYIDQELGTRYQKLVQHAQLITTMVVRCGLLSQHLSCSNYPPAQKNKVERLHTRDRYVPYL